MEKPYKDFGRKIKEIREQAHKSLFEVSGAVEHDIEHLQKIEEGSVQPSEELLVLLASHFELAEGEVLSLWKLAGYGENDTASSDDKKATTVFLPLPDAKIVFTDMVNVSANKYGVTLNFLQGLGSNSQPIAVSRVGMSVEHAEKFLSILQDTLSKLRSQNSQDKPKQIGNS
ncbi:hypothetical protein H6798_00175 [Candidatus Nomurabacteria bacterium]|nr:hypothetical protein [Candidatus Nomurabacteria bacterium]